MTIRWQFHPLAFQSPEARSWLESQANLLKPNTIDSYGRAVNEHLSFLSSRSISPVDARKYDLTEYVSHLRSRPNPRGKNIKSISSGAGLSINTMRLKLTAVRLFYDYLIEEGLRNNNPVGRGRYTPGKGFGLKKDRSLVPRQATLPWIPNEGEWQRILEAVREEPLRNQVIFAMQYDAALRRETVCSLNVGDIDPSYRLINIRAEINKNGRAYVVAYTEPTNILYAIYLRQRMKLSRDSGAIFLSESPRNRAQPISIWTWSKAVKRIARRSGVARLTTHTLRHLCLTDLARAGWELHEIADFAGHRSLETTKIYIHLSGRDLAQKLAKGMDGIHAWRTSMMEKIFSESRGAKN